MDGITRFGRLALLAGALAAGPAPAEGPYKWTDTEGKTHYSQTPPANQGATIVDVDRSAPAPDVRPRSSGKCESVKCLADQMEADRLKREQEYARRRAENERAAAKPKPKSAPSKKEQNDQRLRENCENGLFYGTNSRIDCNDAAALRQAQKDGRGTRRAGRDHR